MKKILVFRLTVVMLLNIGLVAFAAPNGFMGSPGAKPAPTIVSSELPEGCDGKIIITPYSEKDTLPEDAEKFLDKAYDEIVASDDLTDLNEDLDKLADSLKIKGEDLLVSDLFDISVEGCTVHKDHYDFDIVLSADTLKNFVGLLHMNPDGEWELIKDAKVLKNGKHLMFTAKTTGPFAIVVNKGKISPQTQDNSNIYIYMMVVCAGAFAAVTLLKGKKA